MMNYFSDREIGERPRTAEEIGESVWGGLSALIDSRVEDGSFGVDFPDTCHDGFGPIGTNRRSFEAVMRAEIPDLPENPFRFNSDRPPSTIDILDILEFCWHHLGEPISGSYHSFFQHSHLTFDRDLGQHKFSESVNRIFSRNSLAYTFTEDGRIERVIPTILQDELGSAEFRTGDSELDKKLESARRKFLDHDDRTRKESLEDLWDAWERVKTIGAKPNKKAQITETLDDIAGQSSPKFRKVLEQDATALTNIGNDFLIRHFETDREIIAKSEHIDYLFQRLFSLMLLVLRSRTVTSTTRTQPVVVKDDDLPF